MYFLIVFSIIIIVIIMTIKIIIAIIISMFNHVRPRFNILNKYFNTNLKAV